MNQPRLALPFVVLTAPNRVRLIAGEEYRFTLHGARIETWLPTWLDLLAGQTPLDDALAGLDGEKRAVAQELIQRLQQERLLFPSESLPPTCTPKTTVRTLFQDRLDFAELNRFNAQALHDGVAFLWLSTAPLGRGYVSPVCLPHDGPCLMCLVGHFRRLSPLPTLYDELQSHALAGGTIPSTQFPIQGRAILEQLASWKTERLGTPVSFALHVLEVASLEVTAHPVRVDPECSACRGRRG